MRSWWARRGQSNSTRGTPPASPSWGCFCTVMLPSAGLGSRPEVLQLSSLPEYSTGGTAHVIVNNQIGFTTDPKLARSSPHPTDFAKAVGAPIFHVNGDDPEAVAHACQLAVEWRQLFGRDVVVDLCASNTATTNRTSPRVTQPLMYQRISTHPSTATLYAQKLTEQRGGAQQTEVEGWRKEFQDEFENKWRESPQAHPHPQEWLAGNWQGQALGQRYTSGEFSPQAYL